MSELPNHIEVVRRPNDDSRCRRLVDKLIRLHVTVNATKTKLFREELTVLDHRVSVDPDDRASLLRFLALVRYYHDHVAGLSILPRHSRRCPIRTGVSSGPTSVSVRSRWLNAVTLSEPKELTSDERKTYLAEQHPTQEWLAVQPAEQAHGRASQATVATADGERRALNNTYPIVRGASPATLMNDRCVEPHARSLVLPDEEGEREEDQRRRFEGDNKKTNEVQ